MKITAEDLSRSYRGMSDEELLVMDQDHLTDVARKCLEQEMERRGLTHRDPAAPGAPVEVGDEWVSAGLFRLADEAHALLPALQKADIPAQIDTGTGEVIWSGTTAYDAVRLLVPADLVEDAQRAIESFAQAEELAARAEAYSGPPTIAARYEGGVFHPLDPVDLEEGTEVTVELPRH